MFDVREKIIARLVEIAATVPGVVSASRDRIGISEAARPATIGLDAVEAAEEEEPRARPGHAPQLTTARDLRPDRRPAAEIGTVLKAFRRRVLMDAGLLGLAGPNGFVGYAGCATALAAGRSMEGEISLSFAIATC